MPNKKNRKANVSNHNDPPKAVPNPYYKEPTEPVGKSKAVDNLRKNGFGVIDLGLGSGLGNPSTMSRVETVGIPENMPTPAPIDTSYIADILNTNHNVQDIKIDNSNPTDDEFIVSPPPIIPIIPNNPLGSNRHISENPIVINIQKGGNVQSIIDTDTVNLSLPVSVHVPASASVSAKPAMTTLGISTEIMHAYPSPMPVEDYKYVTNKVRHLLRLLGLNHIMIRIDGDNPFAHLTINNREGQWLRAMIHDNWNKVSMASDLEIAKDNMRNLKRQVFDENGKSKLVPLSYEFMTAETFLGYVITERFEPLHSDSAKYCLYEHLVEHTEIHMFDPPYVKWVPVLRYAVLREALLASSLQCTFDDYGNSLINNSPILPIGDDEDLY